jgi:hypothetical protein
MIDVVDFNKSCEEKRGKFLPLSGVPIYYFQCEECAFTFAPEFKNWSEKDFLGRIYNEKYIEVDPDYIEERPRQNFITLKKIFDNQKESIKHLDYGGGNGKLSELLRMDGWDSVSYDPFPKNDTNIEGLGEYDLITAFEVFEHVSDIDLLMINLKKLMNDKSVILFTTLLLDGSIDKNKRLSWWYASPRNGHISLFSRKSLSHLSKTHNLNFGSFNSGFHCFVNRIPAWTEHIFSLKK